MSTETDVRRLATRLPEVVERTSYGTPAFAVAGRLFVRFHDEPGVIVLWVPDLEEREALLAADPRTFFTTDHYTGHRSVLVRLAEVDVDELAELLTDAWCCRAPRRLARSLISEGGAPSGTTAY